MEALGNVPCAKGCRFQAKLTVMCSLGEDGGGDQQCGERWRQTESEGWGVVGREIHLRDMEGKGPTER